MAVVCGNCKQVYGKTVTSIITHPTAADVRKCYENKYAWEAYLESGEAEAEAAAEAWAEGAWLRHAENAGWQETELTRQVEDSRGVVQFDEAYATALAALGG
jgi:hypothetical protein